MTKKKRVPTIVLALAVIFVMLSSAVFILAEADHDCIGEDCRICHQIDVCEDTLRQLSNAVITVAVCAALTYMLVCTVWHFISLPAQTTLITLKIKLSN